MKLIIEFYSGKHRIDAWFLDTKDLPGKPPVLKVHLYRGPDKKTHACKQDPKQV